MKAYTAALLFSAAIAGVRCAPAPSAAPAPYDPTSPTCWPKCNALEKRTTTKKTTSTKKSTSTKKITSAKATTTSKLPATSVPATTSKSVVSATASAPAANTPGAVVYDNYGSGVSCSASGNQSPWVQCKNGQLGYATVNAGGDRIPDFSFAGYGGGGVNLPKPAVQLTLNPSGGDDTAAIQNAINTVGSLPLGSDGFRGAVLLGPGVFNVTGQLLMQASGVVLRGSGQSATLLNVTSIPTTPTVWTLITVQGHGNPSFGTSTSIIDAYVPVNSRAFTVSSSAGFSVGQTVWVARPLSASFVQSVGMANLTRNGVQQSWTSGVNYTHSDRVITAIAGNRITVDAPITDAINSTYGAATITAYTWGQRVSNIGIEKLSAKAPPLTGNLNTAHWQFVNYVNMANGFLNQVSAQDFQFATIRIAQSTKQVTVQDIIINHTVAIDGSAGYPTDVMSIGTQTLFQRIKTTGANIYYLVSQEWSNGPNVFKDVVTAAFGPQYHGGISPHMRWATGILFENITMTNGGTGSGANQFAIGNRGTYGNGQGWAAAYSLGWNIKADVIQVQSPPGAANWCIGCTGTQQTVAPNGIFSLAGTTSWPSSLYSQQLAYRRGTGALSALSPS